MEIQIQTFLPIANLVLAASKDGTRYNLNCVAFDTATGRGRATDGHRLAEAAIPLETKGILGEILIEREACEAILKAKKGFGSVVLSKEKTLIQTPGRTQEFHNVSAQFPDTDQVKPKQEPTFEIALNPELLLGLAKALGMSKGKRAVLRFTDAVSPIVVECEGGSGLLMPMRPDKAAKAPAAAC